MPEGNKKGNKEPQKKTPKAKKTQPAKKQEPKPDDFFGEDIEYMLKDALHEIHESTKRRAEDKIVCLDTLESTIEEFLNSFIIIGYDLDGNPIDIVSAGTQQEADALSTLLNKLVMSKLKGSEPPEY